VTPYNPTIPRGLCQCGCGGRTTPSKKTYARLGLVQGDPNWFLPWHIVRFPKDKYTRRLPEMEEAKPFKVGGEYCRFIRLSNGGICIVSASDYEWLMQWNWHWRCDTSGSIYVHRTGLKAEGLMDKSVAMHRFILGLKHGDPRVGDHVNRNTMDNRRGNIRIATLSENARNADYALGKTGLRGVYYEPKKTEVQG
jgi:hypothetical protein